MSEKFGGLTTTPIKPSAFGGGSGGTVDQTYNPESENAQSGKAVAEAVETKMDKFGDVTESDWGITVSNYEGSKNLEIKTSAAAMTVISGGQLLFHDEGGGTIFEGMGDLDFQYRTLKSVGYPEENTDAANKYYVDSRIGDIDAVLDAIIALQNSIIGGE